MVNHVIYVKKNVMCLYPLKGQFLSSLGSRSVPNIKEIKKLYLQRPNVECNFYYDIKYNFKEFSVTLFLCLKDNSGRY